MISLLAYFSGLLSLIVVGYFIWSWYHYKSENGDMELAGVSLEDDLDVEEFKEIFFSDDLYTYMLRSDEISKELKLLEDKYNSEIGHRLYTQLIEELMEEGVITELREDLIDPEIKVNSVKNLRDEDIEKIKSRIRKKDSMLVYDEPNKTPGKMNWLVNSVLSYLTFEDYGFKFNKRDKFNIEDYRSIIKEIFRISEIENYELNISKVDEGEKLLFEVASGKSKSETEIHRKSGEKFSHSVLEPVAEILKKEKDKHILWYFDAEPQFLLVLDKNGIEFFREWLHPGAEAHFLPSPPLMKEEFFKD